MTRPLTYIIVDDEQASIDRIAQTAMPFQDLLLLDTFTDPSAALGYLGKHHADFVLLDMEMPVVDGKSFMLQMPSEVEVILHTAHNAYATDGFDYGVVDFLRKPASVERFFKAIERMKVRLRDYHGEKGKMVPGDYYYFMMKGPFRAMRTKINLNELVYIDARDDRTYFHLVGNMCLPKAGDGKVDAESNTRAETDRADGFAERIADLVQILRGTPFMQVHRSFILNTDYYRRYHNGTVYLNGFAQTIPVGKRENYPAFFEWMERHHLPSDPYPTLP